MLRRAERLFDIIQMLRGRRLRTAQAIADKLEVSVRTIYRDIDSLVAGGIPIEGERGVGYIIRTPYELPPLQFSSDELQAIALGIRFVRAWADGALIEAAEEALIKIEAVLPDDRKAALLQPLMGAYAKIMDSENRQILADLRKGLNLRRKLMLRYKDDKNAGSQRIVRPLSLESWGHAWTLTAWCELRQDFRVFRVDRIEIVTLSLDHFRPESGKTLADYRNLMGLKQDVQGL